VTAGRAVHGMAVWLVAADAGLGSSMCVERGWCRGL